MISITSPSQGATLVQGSTYDIRWTGALSRKKISLFLVDAHKSDVVQALVCSTKNAECVFSWVPTKAGIFRVCIEAKTRRRPVSRTYSDCFSVLTPTAAGLSSLLSVLPSDILNLVKLYEEASYIQEPAKELDSHIQVLLYVISKAAQATRKTEQHRARHERAKHVLPIVTPQGALEVLIKQDSAVIEKVMQNQSFMRLMSQTIRELMKHSSSFNELRKDELEKKKKLEGGEAELLEMTFEMMAQNKANIEQLKLTESFRWLVKNASQELTKDSIFKQLVKLKSIAELLRYEERETSERESMKDQRGKVEEEMNEESRLHELFGDLETNDMILATIDVLEQGELKVQGVEPKFFDGLLYVLETYSHLAEDVHTVEVVLDRPIEEFEGNLYHLSTVLAILVQESQLRSLTLQKFPPQTLVAVLTSSLHKQTSLELLDLQDNSLETDDVLYALRSLPASEKKLVLNLNHNCLQDEAGIKNFLSHHPNVDVEMAQQNPPALLSVHI